MKNLFFYETPVGRVGVAEKGDQITNLWFEEKTPFEGDYAVKETEILKEARCQLGEYFLGKRKAFDLPLSLTGTKFMNAVWKALLTIPYGETRSYKEIAKVVGSPNACRAVGRANNRNPIPIIIPCHRVIGSDGSLVGYGAGLEIKKHLLELEKRYR